MCQSFVHVEQAFSGFSLAASFQSTSWVSLLFPKWKSHHVTVHANGVSQRRKKVLKELKCWVRRKGGKSKIIFCLFTTVVVKYRNLHCLLVCFGVCFQWFHLFSPCPIYVLKKQQVNSKGHLHRSLRMLPWDPFRLDRVAQGGGCCTSCVPLIPLWWPWNISLCKCEFWYWT